jgi:RHS repeat-associated protein
LANVKRHDYLPFGEELYAPAGARKVEWGYSSGDGVRQQFTSHERDTETQLDYMQARYYQSQQGRFTSADPLVSNGESLNPQGWNRYSYVLNNPMRLIDPTGLDDAEATEEQDKQKQVIKPLEDKIIENRLQEIRKNAKPLAAGETATPTSVEQIQGEQTTLQNATIQTPEMQVEVANGYMRPIALVVLDQGGNIIIDPELSITEDAKPANTDAKVLYDAGRAATTNAQQISQQPNGAFYDLQVRVVDPSKRAMDLQTKVDLVIKSGRINLFMVQGNQVRMNDATKSITFTPGRVRKFGN